MTLQTRLSELLRVMRDEQLALPGYLSEADREAAGTFENWSAKDVLAHNAYWTGNKLEELRMLERGELLLARSDEEEDGVNAVQYERYRDTSLEDVLALLRDSYGRFESYVAGSTEAQLTAEYEAWDSPVWREIAGTAITHPMIHVWEYLQKNGYQDELAARFGPSFEQQLVALQDDPNWQATAFYNMACQDALAGRHEAAIGRLSQAFLLYPPLRDWSQEDSDLDSLRDSEAFGALFE
jgi:hypothetical protein